MKDMKIDWEGIIRNSSKAKWSDYHTISHSNNILWRDIIFTISDSRGNGSFSNLKRFCKNSKGTPMIFRLVNNAVTIESGVSTRVLGSSDNYNTTMICLAEVFKHLNIDKTEAERLLNKAVEAKTSFDDLEDDDQNELEVASEGEKALVRNYVVKTGILDTAIDLAADYRTLPFLSRVRGMEVIAAVRMILEQYYIEHPEIKERLETKFRRLMEVNDDDYDALLYETFVTEIIGASYFHCTCFNVSPKEEIVVFNTIPDALNKHSKPVMTINGPAEITVVNEISPSSKYSFTTEGDVSILLSNTRYYIKNSKTNHAAPLANYETILSAHDNVIVVR